jgi:hypothetical protein
VRPGNARRGVVRSEPTGGKLERLRRHRRRKAAAWLDVTIREPHPVGVDIMLILRPNLAGDGRRGLPVADRLRSSTSVRAACDADACGSAG